MSEWNLRASDRGVSDVVGFVLVFALITSTVAIVYTFGFTGLENAREEERFSNAERVFDILADNVADMRRRGAPSRATEIKLSDATLSYGEETSLTVEVTNMPSSTPTYSTNLEPLVYTTADSPVRLVYENGAVFRERRNAGGVLLDRTGTVFRNDGGTKTAVVPFVQTRQTGSTGVGGSSTVRIRTKATGSEVLATLHTPADADSDPDSDGTDEYAVTYTVETTPNRAPLWETHLEDRISWRGNACSVSGGTVTCTVGVERLYVTVTRIDVSFN